MYKGSPFVSKIIEKKQQQKLLQNHRDNLKHVRPITSHVESMQNYYTINNRKKQMQLQTRFTEIERENRMLLEKITGIMNKRKSLSSHHISETKKIMNKTLNSDFRKRQFQSIQIENAKMLKRLQEKKSDYETAKYKKEWRRTKKMISNLTSYPIILDDGSSRGKKKQFHLELKHFKQIEHSGPEQFQMMKIRLIDGIKFLITVKLTKDQLLIYGDNKIEKQIKVIEIERKEALHFVSDQCEGNIANIFDHLVYHPSEKNLYLVANALHKNEDQLQRNTSEKLNEERKERKRNPREKKFIHEYKNMIKDGNNETNQQIIHRSDLQF